MSQPIPPLEPIVIQPLPITLGNKLFTYTGNGFSFNGHSFHSNPSLSNKRLSSDYLKAQCIFRGLPYSGTIATLRARLQASGSKMKEEFAEAEKRLNLEFRIKNAAARDEKWKQLETHEAKAELDPVRCLKEYFFNEDASSLSEEPLVIETFRRRELHEAARPLGLYSESTGGGPLSEDPRCIVIGRSSATVQEKIREIQRARERERQQQEDQQRERTRKLHQTILSKQKSDPESPWDVTGEWAIDCPYIK